MVKIIFLASYNLELHGQQTKALLMLHLSTTVLMVRNSWLVLDNLTNSYENWIHIQINTSTSHSFADNRHRLVYNKNKPKVILWNSASILAKLLASNKLRLRWYDPFYVCFFNLFYFLKTLSIQFVQGW